MALYKQRPDLKAYLELILSIITIGLFVIFAIKPTLVTIAGLITKIQSLEETSTQLTTKITNLGLAQNLYNQNATNITLLAQAVPNGTDIGGFVRQAEGALKKENLSAVSITVGETSLAGSSESGKINVTTISSGDFSGLINFIKDLEILRRPSLITKLDLTSVTDQSTLNLTTTTEVPYTTQ